MAAHPMPLSGNQEWRSELAKLPVPLAVSSDPISMACLKSLIEKGRVSREQGISLFENPSLSSVTSLADMVKKSRYGNNVFFNENLHVNTTNICVLACRFCAFRKGPRHPEAYSLDIDEYLDRIRPLSDSIDEVHTVGGLHPKWDVNDYCKLFSATKEEFPDIHIKALTAVEIKHLSKLSSLSIEETLTRLSDAGLDSLPGGGAEILVDQVRDRICMGKESSQEYLDIHSVAHQIGMPTNCTMLFGTVESIEDRVTHLIRLRQQQDVSKGFQCFVPYPFLPDKTRLPEAQLATGSEIIRVISISRILLDNIPHIKAYRMNIGDKLSSLALTCGADDIDGTVGHEEIMHVAGSSTRLDTSTDQLAALVKSSRSIPVKRNSNYSSFERYSTSNPSYSRVLPQIGMT
ncbi:MAG: aminofutalosine synthase MqnE [Methanobacteriota archaeon]|nr:MAG: aminofutalosine synthase MqnE [Euryarchaeota archaeon]|tara:strand:- start:1029 stop:2240 length:1212 start_codon:yes stop_codon:yes gene_type:complete